MIISYIVNYLLHTLVKLLMIQTTDLMQYTAHVTIMPISYIICYICYNLKEYLLYVYLR
jgi:hypothetical protein